LVLPGSIALGHISVLIRISGGFRRLILVTTICILILIPILAIGFGWLSSLGLGRLGCGISRRRFLRRLLMAHFMWDRNP
jgi:hypothetical protein